MDRSQGSKVGISINIIVSEASIGISAFHQFQKNTIIPQEVFWFIDIRKEDLDGLLLVFLWDSMVVVVVVVDQKQVIQLYEIAIAIVIAIDHDYDCR